MATKTKDKKNELTVQQKDFLYGNLWKTVIKMMIPTIIMMLFFGIYNFSDTIIGIHFANDSYQGGGAHVVGNPFNGSMTGADQVRLYMGTFSPLNLLTMGITFMVSGGISTRVAVNLGAGRRPKAINTLKTGFTIALVSSILLIPVLIFAAKPWMSATIDNPALKEWISARAFDYAAPIIGSLPFMVLGNTIAGLFRVEGRNKEMLLMMTLPILLNLGFDMIFMGPLKMDISGGAWATAISNLTTTGIGTFLIIRRKDNTILKFKNMLGLKLKYVTLIGIFLVGIGAFFSNFGQSLTTTLESTTIQQASTHVYLNQVQAAAAANPGLIQPGQSAESLSSMLMFSQMQTLSPIFLLVFPLVFAQADAVKPIASFNFGAGNIARAKKTVWITFLYIFIASIVVYVIFAFGLRYPLFMALSVAKSNVLAPTMYNDTTKSLWVMLSTIVVCSPLVVAQVWFGSTDKFLGNLIVSSAWFLVTIPMLFLFKFIAINSDIRFIFWAIYPAIGFVASVISFTWMIISMKVHKRSNLDIEAKIRLAKISLSKPKSLKAAIARERDERKAEVQSA